MLRHNIRNSPLIISPGTNHYSWPKGATLLGIGQSNVIAVHVDKDARQNVAELKNILEQCLQTKTSVFMVVVVMGSTEEGAVVPLCQILTLREEYRERGLNFMIHADAAWGGYLLTMLSPSNKSNIYTEEKRGDFVPHIPLSTHVEAQFHVLKYVDTVTIDPHKSGLCLYPAGSLCYRNRKMREFVSMKASEVYHGEDDKNVAVFGIEGSKPGASAASVALSHKVIGLNDKGYGRILGQCQFSAKLFYCLWMTVAKDYDEWHCLNFVDMPSCIGKTVEEQKGFIRRRILGRQNTELIQDREAMEFLSTIGPDALINTFAVNMKSNTDILICNEIQQLLFDETNGKRRALQICLKSL
ncbi:L-tyrosine decarboxylase-like [Hydractinia symbiolongicarpus]|uniref:L-tyrosine decarboxylase-like n=1 Tax=Hydractinia symbiolongicarpus TaxID=13093 RepID=UPI00254AC836|nr:L-tyrosine decarboxylase-like [Hydractinia symbiolongicarpus]XP_057291896.1 L-tyrosine decarboxylase-like [Hydractinia symbiolongicarpus]